MRDDYIAWAAGLFEGEGCINIAKNKPESDNLFARLTMVTTDKDVLERFALIVEGGHINPVPWQYKPNRAGIRVSKPQWRWKAGSEHDVETILTAFYPYLGERRRVKADEALALIAKKKEARR